MTEYNDTPDEIQISEGELLSMTRDLDEMHEESMSEVRSSMAQTAEQFASFAKKPTHRRTILLGSMGLVGVGALAACGSGSTSVGGGTPSSPASSSGSSTNYTGDFKVVALAAALENLAVAGYGLALTTAGKGTYGKVPPAIATFIETAMKQHKDHAAAWNSVLTQNSLAAVTGTPLTITNATVAELKKQKTVAGVAKVALSLENAAAETYVFAAANVSSAGGIATAASIAPVEAMHAAILSYVLGKYPVPNAYIGVSGAVQPSALTAS